MELSPREEFHIVLLYLSSPEFPKCTIHVSREPKKLVLLFQDSAMHDKGLPNTTTIALIMEFKLDFHRYPPRSLHCNACDNSQNFVITLRTVFPRC